MSEPIVFISHFRVKQGKLEAFKQLTRQVIEQLQASKPGTVAYLAYLNEDGTELSFVHVFPDANAMDLHVQGADERSKTAYEFIEPVSREIYGAPSDQVMTMMRQIDRSGNTLTLQPRLIGGYIRLKPK